MSTKSAQSGLRSIKRDFSSSTMASSSSQEIYWPPTPQPQKQPVAAPKLTGSQQRLKDIQDALSGKPPSSHLSAPLVESKAVNKRTSLEAEAAPPAAKRPRQLPPSWGAKDSLSDPSFSSQSEPPSSRSSTSSRKTTKSVSSSASHSITSGSKPKVASVFLSQEQTQILKLVQDGDSVFYTGSAGQ